MPTSLFPVRAAQRHAHPGSGSHPHPRFLATALAVALFLMMALPLVASAHTASGGNSYTQTNLVSDISGMAQFTDPDLVNPWGLSRSSSSPWWVSDNGTGLSTLYDGAGNKQSLIVKIPPPAGSPKGTIAAPTGTVFNGTGQFMVSQGGKTGSALFLFVTEDGTISGWSPSVNGTKAIRAVDNSNGGKGAVYKGMTLASSGGKNYFYVTNFRAATVEVYNSKFKQVHLAGSFSDPYIPAGYAPFNIQLINGDLYVTYAKQDAAKHDDVPGLGHGFVDVFDSSGNLLKRLISRGKLDSPWGIVMAPSSFGAFSNDLLVGNFGNGHINVYDPNSGAFLGQLDDTTGNPIVIDGLWMLDFGNGGSAGPTTTLFFTAGIDGEAHGLFGTIVAG